MESTTKHYPTKPFTEGTDFTPQEIREMIDLAYRIANFIKMSYCPYCLPEYMAGAVRYECIVEVKRLYELACNAGSTLACVNLGIFFESLDWTNKAIKWFWRYNLLNHLIETGQIQQSPEMPSCFTKYFEDGQEMYLLGLFDPSNTEPNFDALVPKFLELRAQLEAKSLKKIR